MNTVQPYVRVHERERVGNSIVMPRNFQSCASLRLLRASAEADRALELEREALADAWWTS